jgi:surface protein
MSAAALSKTSRLLRGASRGGDDDDEREQLLPTTRRREDDGIPQAASSLGKIGFLMCALALTLLGTTLSMTTPPTGTSNTTTKAAMNAKLGSERIGARGGYVPYSVELVPTTTIQRKPVTDVTFFTAIERCLAEAPTDGKCIDYGSRSLYGPIPEWNVSLVTNMDKAFENRVDFNPESLSDWDTSQVTSMHWMFFNCREFNGDVRGWQTGNVEDMSGMFYNATKFTRKIGEWDTSSVTNMHGMFQFAASFNKNILEWDTGKVANSANMFKNATDWYKKFSCPNDSSVPSDCSCTACVKQEEFLESIEECLRLAPGGNCEKGSHGAIHLWDVSKVTDMSSAFENRELFKDVGISNWDVSSVTRMDNMFRNAVSFNGDISKWNVENVQSAHRMFKNAKAFDKDIRGWVMMSLPSSTSTPPPTTTMAASLSTAVSEKESNHASWDMFTGADAWLIKYGCPSCQQFEGPPKMWSTLNEHPPPSPPLPSPPMSPTPPFDPSKCASTPPFENLHECEDTLIHKEECSVDPSTNEETCAVQVKVPVLGFCAMKAAINRLNKIECGYLLEQNTLSTLDALTTPVNLRGIGDYLDGLATVLETQIAPAPRDIFASSLAQQEEERTEEIPSENDGDDDDDDGVYGMIKDRKKGWFGF